MENWNGRHNKGKYYIKRAAIPTLVSLLIIVNLGRGGVQSVGPHHQAKKEATTWKYKDYLKALDTLLPLDGDIELGQDIAWRLIIRIMPSWGAESRLRIEKRWNGRGEFSLAQPEGRSISIWDDFLRQENQGASFDEILSRIRIRERNMDTDSCPALGVLIGKLEVIKTPLIPSSAIILDTTSYEIRCRTRTNSRSLSWECVYGDDLCKIIDQILAVIKNPHGSHS